MQHACATLRLAVPVRVPPYLGLGCSPGCCFQSRCPSSKRAAEESIFASRRHVYFLVFVSEVVVLVVEEQSPARHFSPTAHTGTVTRCTVTVTRPAVHWQPLDRSPRPSLDRRPGANRSLPGPSRRGSNFDDSGCPVTVTRTRAGLATAAGPGAPLLVRPLVAGSRPLAGTTLAECPARTRSLRAIRRRGLVSVHIRSGQVYYSAEV
jgi:hypothetical protein